VQENGPERLAFKHGPPACTRRPSGRCSAPSSIAAGA
jgi:hypothetical protein